MSEYPEHIDQIDDFYRSQLADHEIEPPEGLWDKISLSAFEAPSPETTVSNTTGVSSSASSVFTQTQKIIGLSITSCLIVAGSLYFYFDKESGTPLENNTLPSTGQSIKQQNPNASPQDQGPEHTVSPSSDQLNNKTQQPSINKKESESIAPEVLEKQTEETNAEAPVTTPAVIEEQKADSIAEIKTTQKAPKEKVKFKDKYKKDYQDSTRKIFVPGK